MIGGVVVSIKIFLKNLFIIFCISFVSLSLNNVVILGNPFVFVIPWIMFCLIINKYLGYVSFFCVFFSFDLIRILIMIGFVGTFMVFRYLLKFNKNFKELLSFYSFGISFFGALIYLFSKGVLVVDCFFSSVICYWVTRCFYEVYFNKSYDHFSYSLTVFLFVFLGVVFMGANLNIWFIDLSLIVLVFLAFLVGKVGKSEGVLYTFFIVLLWLLTNKNIGLELMMFMCCFIISSLLNNVSKMTMFFSYVLIVISCVYYLDVSYFLALNYILGALSYVFVPSKWFYWLTKRCINNEEFYRKMKKEDRSKNLYISNRITKLEEVFTLVCNKLNVNGRIKKQEKVLLCNEVNIFSDILTNFSRDVKEMNRYGKVGVLEKEICEKGVELLNLSVKEDLLGKMVVRLKVRCSERELKKNIVPCVNRALSKCMKIHCLKINEIMDYCDVMLVETKLVDFKVGIAQRAKEGNVCGDSYLIYENEMKKMFILSDGMGSGEEANKNAKMAIDIFVKFVEIGFEIEQALVSLNNILKNEYCKESYATFDVFVYDKVKNEFYFYKNGANQSFIFRNNKFLVVEGNDLPLGIVDKIEINVHKIDVEKGDFIVMSSDGVNEESIKKVKFNDCQKNCNQIISGQNNFFDDQSVIVIEIKK